MLALSTPRKPAPLLAWRGAVGRTGVWPDAFGNALGNSIADSMKSTPDQADAETARLKRYEAAATNTGGASGSWDLPISGPAGALLLGGGGGNASIAAQAGALAADIGTEGADATAQRVVVIGERAPWYERALYRLENMFDPTSAAYMFESSGVAGSDQSAGAPYDEFGLFSMPGSTPIWDKMVNPIAGAVGRIGPGMQEFKAGALSQLEYKGQLAVHAGDDSALRSAAIRHTFVDMALPGSPQELTLGVGGGAVLGKAVGMVSGSLSRMAAESTSFKFLNADIGEFAGGQLDNALANVADVFRPNRLASDMSFEQTEALKNLTLAAYEQLKLAGNSNAALSPAFTVAQDMVTGEVRFGLNNKMGDVPANLADTLDSRLLNMPPEVQASYIRTANAGSHSEIYAVNDLLLARPGASMSEIAVSTIETGSPAWARGLYKPACPHCEFLLNGVHYVK